MSYNRKVPFPALFFVVFSFAIFYLFLFYCCCSSSAVAVLMVQSVPPAVVFEFTVTVIELLALFQPAISPAIAVICTLPAL